MADQHGSLPAPVGERLLARESQVLQLPNGCLVLFSHHEELGPQTVVKVDERLVSTAHHPVLAEALDHLRQQLLPVRHRPDQLGLGRDQGGEKPLAGVDEGTAQLPPPLPAGQPGVLLAGEELDELPDDGLGGHREGGGELLTASQEELGVERLQQGQRLGQTVYKQITGQLAHQLAECRHGDPPQESCRLPVFSPLEESQDPLESQPGRDISNAQARQLSAPTALAAVGELRSGAGLGVRDLLRDLLPLGQSASLTSLLKPGPGNILGRPVGLLETLGAELGGTIELGGGELEGQRHGAIAGGQNTSPGVLRHWVVVVR